MTICFKVSKTYHWSINFRRWEALVSSGSVWLNIPIYYWGGKTLKCDWFLNLLKSYKEDYLVNLFPVSGLFCGVSSCLWPPGDIRWIIWTNETPGCSFRFIRRDLKASVWTNGSCFLHHIKAGSCRAAESSQQSSHHALRQHDLFSYAAATTTQS